MAELSWNIVFFILCIPVWSCRVTYPSGCNHRNNVGWYLLLYTVWYCCMLPFQFLSHFLLTYDFFPWFFMSNLQHPTILSSTPAVTATKYWKKKINFTAFKELTLVWHHCETVLGFLGPSCVLLLQSRKKVKCNVPSIGCWLHLCCSFSAKLKNKTSHQTRFSCRTTLEERL